MRCPKPRPTANRSLNKRVARDISERENNGQAQCLERKRAAGDGAIALDLKKKTPPSQTGLRATEARIGQGATARLNNPTAEFSFRFSFRFEMVSPDGAPRVRRRVCARSAAAAPLGQAAQRHKTKTHRGREPEPPRKKEKGFTKRGLYLEVPFS